MENNLPQQLEDKKIIAVPIAYLEDYVKEAVLENKLQDEMLFKCDVKKILEQAIAEIEKQKQNFIDIINSLGEIRGKSNDLQCIKLGESFSTNSVEWLKKELLKQLNQPNSERKE